MLSLPVLLSLAAVQSTIQVDPLLIVQADEVWSVIGRRDNAIWPGWDARKTPILIYYPGKQDLLINHPNPPEGFRRYDGPVRSKAGTIYLREAKTHFDLDGQNTSVRLNGVETLVVADTLSTLRQRVAGLASSVLADSAKADRTIANGLAPDPYASMLMFAHEAFHAYQHGRTSRKMPQEMDLVQYPSLSIENNLGYALEAGYLAAALAAKDEAGLRREALKWLAARTDRRAALPRVAQEYEDATEFSEGLAKYVEYRTLQVMEGRRPAPEMWLVQGFRGYDDLQSERDRMVRQMQGYLSGMSVVNGDPYGASPVRFRLYFSGMAVGALLDRLKVRWHERAFESGTTLTSLATEALGATVQELRQVRSDVTGGERYNALRATMAKRAQDGAAHIAEVLAEFQNAPAELVIDYSGLKSSVPRFTYTSFGILRIDDDRNVFRLIPIRGEIGGVGFREDAPRPVLHDRRAKTIRLQLTGLPVGLAEGTVELPGATLTNVRGRWTVEGRRVTLTLAEASTVGQGIVGYSGG